MPFRPKLSLKVGEYEELPHLLNRAIKLGRSCGFKKKVLDKIAEDVMAADSFKEALDVLGQYFEQTV